MKTFNLERLLPSEIQFMPFYKRTILVVDPRRMYFFAI